MPDREFSVRLLSAGPFVTMIDRFAVAPVLIPIALEFRAPLGSVAIAATAHYLAYGLAQPFWGFASDRAGRIRIIRISLAATSAACALSALAPNLDLLIAARIIAGASVCAVLPNEVRGTAAALFVTGAFTGGAIGTGLGAGFAQAHQYGALFLGAAALTVPVVVTAAVARSRYPGSMLAEPIAEVAGS